MKIESPDIPAVQVMKVTQEVPVGFWQTKKEILKDLSFEISKNSIVGLLGPNGAGKTTLIYLLVGMRAPTRGHVLIFGRPSEQTQSKRRIGYLPERPYFYEHLTGGQFLKLMAVLAGIPAQRVSKEIDRTLKTVGMKNAENLELRKYSKGMLQRIGIAQAILGDPEILILDEPMSGLDPLGRKEIRDLILKLGAEGRTILFSSHVISDIETICRQVAFVHKGRLVSYGPIEGLLTHQEDEFEIAISEREWAKNNDLLPKHSECFEMPGGMRILVKGKRAFNQVLERIISSQGEILWAMPHKRSLEDYFSEVVKKND